MGKVKAIGLGVSLLVLSACGVSGYSFVDMPQVCETVLADSTQDLRILFMFDNSGSTVPEFKNGVQISSGTDPDYFYRVQTTMKFLGKYGSKANFTYSLGFFAGNDASFYQRGSGTYQDADNGPAGATDVFGNAALFAAWLQDYSGIGASGATPYAAAFRALKESVKADEAAGHKQDYVVVFMSDGEPSDLGASAASKESGIRSMVDGLKQAVRANGSSLLTISTVYFGSPNAGTAKQNLALMASEGGGQFLDANLLSAAEFSIDDIIQVPRLRCSTPGRSGG